MDTDNQTDKQQDFDKFDSVASKLFQIPIEEVRELEKKEIKRGKKADSPSDAKQ